jgi:hypothetical protein
MLLEAPVVSNSISIELKSISFFPYSYNIIIEIHAFGSNPKRIEDNKILYGIVHY